MVSRCPSSAAVAAAACLLLRGIYGIQQGVEARHILAHAVAPELGNPLGCAKEVMAPFSLGRARISESVQYPREFYAAIFGAKTDSILVNGSKLTDLVKAGHDAAALGWPDEALPTRCDGTPSAPPDPHPLEAGWPGLLAESRDNATLGGQTRKYLDELLQGLGQDEPLIVTVLYWMPNFPMQGGDFLCTMNRLNLSRRLVVFALDETSRDFAQKMAPAARTVYHEGIMTIEVSLMQIRTSRRLIKLVAASLLLERGYTILVTDTDTVWLQNPLEELAKLNGDMLAQQDRCEGEINSGFLYYRPTRNVRDMLRISLAIQPWVGPHGEEMITDNDQYLLNCAVSAAATSGGVRPLLLPEARYPFNGLEGRAVPCAETRDVGDVVVWHTSRSAGGVSADFLKSHGMANVAADGACDVTVDPATLRRSFKAAIACATEEALRQGTV